MDELVAWLREQIAHVRKLAQDCLTEVGHHVAGEQYEDGSGEAYRDAYPSYPWGSGEAELAYMAATQPRYVLAQCDAHAAIVDFCVEDPLCHDGGWAYIERVLTRLALAYQHCDGYRDEWRP